MPMTITLRLIAIASMLAVSGAAHASCKIIPFRFNTNGDTVSTRAVLSSGETCFHTLRNNTGSGNIFTGLSVEQRPSHGTLTLGSAAFQYHAQAGYHGADTYAVKICMQGARGRGCSVAVVEATVE
jgi:hypothetical protein